jgi:hypothetical protein
MDLSMGMLGSFLNPSRGYKEAGKQVQQGWNNAVAFEAPYAQHGGEMYSRLNEAFNKLLNPGALENEWAQGYETSPYAKQLLESNKSQGLDAASSMGLMGSSAALGNIQTGAGNIVSQDREKYMKDLMEKFIASLGLGTNIYGAGATAAGNLANNATQTGTNMATTKYGEYNAPGDMFMNLLKTGAQAAGGY